MPRRRKKVPIVTPTEIATAIYRLETRGKHARSHIKEELTMILNAAKAQLADYQKGLENHRRHKKRNPNWPSSIRSAAWFAANRREVRDEPKQVNAEGQEEHKWKSLEEYEAWIHQPVPKAASTPASPVKTRAELDYEANLRTSRKIGKERGEQGWDD